MNRAKVKPKPEPDTDSELAKFQADLLQSVREFKTGNFARKTVVALKPLPSEP